MARYGECVGAAGQLVACDGLCDATLTHDRRDVVVRMVVVLIERTEAPAQADRDRAVPTWVRLVRLVRFGRLVGLTGCRNEVLTPAEEGATERSGAEQTAQMDVVPEWGTTVGGGRDIADNWSEVARLTRWDGRRGELG